MICIARYYLIQNYVKESQRYALVHDSYLNGNCLLLVTAPSSVSFFSTQA